MSGFALRFARALTLHACVPRRRHARTSLLYRHLTILITVAGAVLIPVHAQEPSGVPPPAADDTLSLPRMTPLAPLVPPDRAAISSDNPQSRHDNLYAASGNVELTYRNRTLRADAVSYDADSGDITLTGHVRISGGENDEYIEASHGTYNLKAATGRLYDVTGSVGMHGATYATANQRRTTYQSPNPLLFQGRLLVKNGPSDYVVYDGSVTSCLLPHPDWQLVSRRFNLTGNRASATNSTFRLVGIPILYLPYVTHPVDTTQRQSGLLIPVVGYSSASKDTGSKGFTFGEQAYFALGRSADATVGTLFYSLRGFSENGTFRYRGPNDDFFTAHFSALQDRGFTTSTGVPVNQGGQDVTAAFRRQLTPHTRAVGDFEYLSSYIYREAFTENFNQAVSSDILSIGYVTHENAGFAFSGRADRYQGLKRVAINNQPGQQVRIFHAPSFDLTGVDHPIPHTPLLWSLNTSVAGLKRVQPNFVSSGIIERFDLRPELALPLSFQGFHMLASVAVRETVYSRSRRTPYPAGSAPVELTAPVNRAALEMKLDLRIPVIEREFIVPRSLQRFFGDSVRHTIEPELVYRNTRGIDNFLSVLRFDDTDLVANTDELLYGVTQHLYFKPHAPARKSRPGCPVASSQPREPLSSLREAGGSASPPAADPREQQTTPTAGDSDDRPDAPDALLPSPQSSVDANGIPSASTDTPDAPTRTHLRHADPCAEPADAAGPSQQEWFSWRLAQKHFFDPTFGGAVINGRRNLFDSTLSLSGIAYLTEARNISPLVSRMRFRTSSHTDVEWNFDLDTGASKFTSNNIFLDTHEGPWFGGIAYARLSAPGRFYTENLDTNNSPTLTVSSVSNFQQMRLLLGYGAPGKAGFSAAGNAGLDLSHSSVQYATLQANYNWNCCGLSIEYRKYELGSVRNENAYRFNFTLANIGTAGNLRRRESLF